MFRDFTINAIYFAPESGLFLDPTRGGFEALAGRKLEFAGPSDLAHTHPFLSLRAVKFMAKGYGPGGEVARFLQTHLDDDLQAHGSRLLSLWLFRQVPCGALDAFADTARGFLATPRARGFLEEAVALCREHASGPAPAPVTGGRPGPGQAGLG